MNAVIYARYSSDNQREESIEGQLRECKEYAERSGMNVVATYIDRALSAKTDDRLIINFNYRDGDKLVSLQEVKSSFLGGNRSPDENRTVQPKTVVQCGILCI